VTPWSSQEFLYHSLISQQNYGILFCYIRYVRSARKCIDLCVYTITCSELVDVIVSLYKLGVQVRVITDNDQLDASGSQVGRFRVEG